MSLLRLRIAECRQRLGQLCAAGLLLAGMVTAPLSVADAAEPPSGRNGFVKPVNEQRFPDSIVQLRLTFYWMAYEHEYDDDAYVSLLDKEGQEIAVVPVGFADELAIEGTGVLLNGDTINIYKSCDNAPTGYCYFIVDESQAPYGWGSLAPLAPYRSVALSYPVGTDLAGKVLYLPALDGAEVTWRNETFVHDGCVAVVDLVSHLGKYSIDLFVGKQKNYPSLELLMGKDIALHEPAAHCPDTMEELYGW